MAQRKIDNIDKTILVNFYKLVHEQPTIRLRAATSTFKILEAFRKQKSPKFNENLNYCVERLVVGLASSRAQARRGYAILLLEILKQHQLTTDRLLTIASAKFAPINKDTSKDDLMGHFLIGSLILESGNIAKSKANTMSLEKIYRSFIKLHKTKSYFDVPICETLQRHSDLLYQFMLEDIPKGAFDIETKLTALDIMIISLCNSKETIKEFTSMDNTKVKQVISVLRVHNLKRSPLHPLLAIISEVFINHWPNHFEAFYKEIIDMQADITKELINKASLKNLIKYIDRFIEVFVNKSNNRHRGAISQILAHAIRRPQLSEQPTIVLKVVKVCMINSLFKATSDRKNDPVLQSFHSSLDCLISVSNAEQRVEMLNSLLDIVKVGYLKEASHRNLWQKFYSRWTAERKALFDTKHKHLSCIASLYLLYGLQVIEHELVCDKQLEELKESTDAVVKGDPTDGSWADILTDQIIAILSATECDPWVRNLCDKVFGALLPHISQTSIDLLCDALAPNADLDDEESCCSDDEDMGSDDDDDDDDDQDEDEYDSIEQDNDEKEIQYDSKQVNADKGTNCDDEMIDLGSEGDDHKSESSIESNENSRKASNGHHVNMEVDGSEDEEYMDDEQMMKYDKVLVEMFKLRRLDKKKDNVQIGFKLRLLDLVKRIVKKKNKDQDTVSLLLASIIPLAKSSRSSKEALPIHTKVKGILSKMPAKSKYPEIAKFLAK